MEVCIKYKKNKERLKLNELTNLIDEFNLPWFKYNDGIYILGWKKDLFLEVRKYND